MYAYWTEIPYNVWRFNRAIVIKKGTVERIQLRAIIAYSREMYWTMLF